MRAVRQASDGLVYFVLANGTVDAFDPCTNSTTRVHTGAFNDGSRSGFALTSVNDSLLACGGYDYDGTYAMRDGL